MPMVRSATLRRLPDSNDGTLGVLTANNGRFRCVTMEPPWRDNKRNLSCIPEGWYEVLPHRSPRFGACLLITGVQGRSHILFHTGNLGGDRLKGLKTHTAGCILPGQRRGVLQGQRAVLGSRTAFRKLMAWTEGRPFDLVITNTPGG